jgi:hypothetical protein
VKICGAANGQLVVGKDVLQSFDSLGDSHVKKGAESSSFKGQEVRKDCSEMGYGELKFAEVEK